MFNEIERFRIRCCREIGLERQWLQVWKFPILVLWIHRFNLFWCRRSHHFEYFSDLIFRVLSWEKWAQFEELSDYAASRPNVNLAAVLSAAKDQFRGSVVS